MKFFALGCFGFVLGAFLGGIAGAALGLVWTSAAHTSCFEGYCGMLVFLSFMPIGALVGGAIGAAALAALAGRETPPDMGSN